MTNSAFMVGMVAFARGLPLLVLSPISGILADFWRRQRVMALALLLGAFASGSLIALTLADVVAPWHIVLASFLIGSSFALYAPARLALLPSLIPEGIFVSASTVEYSSTRVVGSLGPIVAGGLLDWLGSPVSLGAQFGLFCLGAFIFLNTGLGITGPNASASHHINFRQDLGQAASHVSHDRALLSLLLLGLVIIPVGLAYQRVMPVFARDVFGVGATMLGVMLGLGDIGVALASLGIAAVGDSFPKGRAMRLAAGLTGAGLVLLAFTRSITFGLILLFVLGVVSGVYLTLTNVLFQIQPPDRLRGRVMSAWAMVWGILPITSLAVGALAEKWPVNLVIGVCGGICLVSAAGIPVLSNQLNEL